MTCYFCNFKTDKDVDDEVRKIDKAELPKKEICIDCHKRFFSDKGCRDKNTLLKV